ncbi:hypothetical protein BJ912DRAFT_920628 [Pholiota molesta]|nr:hypothetical protein BJ912DRAFT_920628 [Pholiota molesta]
MQFVGALGRCATSELLVILSSTYECFAPRGRPLDPIANVASLHSTFQRCFNVEDKRRASFDALPKNAALCHMRIDDGDKGWMHNDAPTPVGSERVKLARRRPGIACGRACTQTIDAERYANKSEAECEGDMGRGLEGDVNIREAQAAGICMRLRGSGASRKRHARETCAVVRPWRSRGDMYVVIWTSEPGFWLAKEIKLPIMLVLFPALPVSASAGVARVIVAVWLSRGRAAFKRWIFQKCANALY